MPTLWQEYRLMYKFDFTLDEYQYFLDNCPFSDEEVEVLQLKRRCKSQIEISLALNLSERTVRRRTKSLHQKIKKLMLKNVPYYM